MHVARMSNGMPVPGSMAMFVIHSHVSSSDNLLAHKNDDVLVVVESHRTSWIAVGFADAPAENKTLQHHSQVRRTRVPVH
jgi:hypothetical protein